MTKIIRGVLYGLPRFFYKYERKEDNYTYGIFTLILELG